MTPPMNVAWLVAKFGAARAFELAVAAEPHDGADLFRLGIAQSVVEEHQVLDTARNLAQRFASYDRKTLTTTKRMIQAANGRRFSQVLEEIQSSSTVGP